MEGMIGIPLTDELNIELKTENKSYTVHFIDYYGLKVCLVFQYLM